ncbi:ShlB/FhaC/HecB family hemolysin secretion/activation protein [Herminiimonas arsenitoxidans]|uniref:ShlB/FhaC/HecB family hemolysin secretion/activation protein n=1 Tax=Herminiimonas arsenitoxidans TaxID=1809410 RepID=UPI0009FB4C26|nr:ShlB/FhaC/HecB family hemolysin secretion/activation protein [Herminiimonas arsenitoxidans]
MLLSDTPGIDVRSSLRPGASVGTTDLDILIKDGKPLDADISVDNFGNRYSGEYRLNGNLTLNNPFGLGDALQIRSTTAGEKFNYVRLSYQLLLNDRGTRLGVAYAAMQYKLGEDFKRLDAHGTANIASLFLTHPFIRSRAFNLNGQINFDHKVLNDRIDLIGTESNKKLNNFTFGVSGDSNDQFNGGGINQASLSVTVGDLQLDSASASLDAIGHRTQGRFTKTNLQALRLQRLTEQLSLYGQLSTQLAGDNLDSAEKMSLGGSYGVRAYPQGEAPADDAWLINLELRYAFAAQWQAMLFYDAAQGRINHKPIAADGNNRRNLSGVGAGIKWANQDGYSLQTTVAWRTDDEPTSDKDKLPRVWLQFAKSF